MSYSEGIDPKQQRSQEARINNALGLFLLFFAVVILISILFTRTLIGRLANLVAAGLIGLIGGAMVWWSRRSRRPEGPR